MIVAPYTVAILVNSPVRRRGLNMASRGRWRLIAVITLVILFLAVVVVALMGPHDPAVTLILTGTPGSKFRGTIEVDGVPREITGQVPADFRFRGSRIAFVIKRLDGLPNDEIAIKKFVNGQHCGESGGRGGVTGGLVVLESGLLLFGNFPLGKVDARWWDAGIDFEDRDREIILDPDARRIIWAPREPRAPDRDE
jgi:hypothetical protein